MYVRINMPIKMLIGALVGLLSAGAFGVLLSGFLPGVFGGQANILWLLLGLALLFSGPFLLGITNARWPGALIAGVVAPIVGWTLSGLWSILFSVLEHLLHPFPFDRVTTLVAVYIIILVGTTELLTRQPFKEQAFRILRGMGLGLSIAFGLELLRNVAQRVTGSGPVVITEREIWITAIVYAVLCGINVIYFDGLYDTQSDHHSNLSTAIFASINLLALVSVIATSVVI